MGRVLMVDWTRPLKMVPRPDVDGGSYGPDVYLRAMLTDTGTYIPLSSQRIDRDTQRHFADQFRQGVRFMVTAERENSKPIYYKADGTPWLGHHAALVNRAGPSVSLTEQQDRAVRELEKIERARAQARDAADMRRVKAINDAQRAAAEQAREQDAIESHPLWGMF